MVLRAGEEPLILSIDTATEVRSVAIARGERQLSLVRGVGSSSHSASVLSEVDAALRAARLGVEQIELFAAAAGPGSFTGLRAGLATLKAFAATLERPVVGVPTLHAVARAAAPTAGAIQVLAAIPAGRGEVFAQLLDVTARGEVVERDDPEHIVPAALIERAVALRKGLKWAGGGAHALAEQLRERARREAILWGEEGGSEPFSASGWLLARPAVTLSEHVAALALRSFRKGSAGRAEELRAIYVRPSDAETKQQCHAPRESPK